VGRSLALPLLVPRIAANDENSSLATDDLAVLADPFDAGTNFHDSILLRLANAVGTKLANIRNPGTSEKA
jgi:hypothetical protein